MPNRPARTTQADIARAIRAVKQTGGGMAVDVKSDGTICIYPYVDLLPSKISVEQEPLACM